MLNRRKNGFTLIELLVVVAIIALLISILLPSLASAKRQAKRAVCASNLHQIGIAMPQYTHDNKDWYPSNGRPPDGNWNVKGPQGWPVYYNMVWQYGGNAGHSWANRPAHLRLMYRYLYPEFFQCPDDRPPIYVKHDGKSSYWSTGTSYPLNGYNWASFATVFPKSFGRLGILDRKSTDVTFAKCVITGDAVMDEFFSDCDPWPPPPKPPKGAGYRWHDLNKPRANVVFADGSVDFVLINASERRVKVRNYWWWEGIGYSYSFCPTHPSKRYETPWYQPGR